MSPLQNRDEVFNAALRLTEEDRWVLVSSLLDSLPNDPPMMDVDDANFHDELRGRSGDQARAVDWRNIHDELRQVINARCNLGQ